MTASGFSGEGVERQIQRLSAERTELFARGTGGAAMSDIERRRSRESDGRRLRGIEAELDRCFQERRAHRAARDAQRFRA